MKMSETVTTTGNVNSTAGTGHPYRVFVVEDAPVVRELLIDQIGGIPNVEVVGYADTESDAINFISSHPCDLVILDIHLKVGNGLDVLKYFSTHGSPAGDRPASVIFSNFVDAGFRQLAARYGAERFFDKVSGYPALISFVEEMAGG
ncbi:MAG: response regulator transcription factor [Gammaproteobacteria bacterium]|nr:response regulator transcription factor [Gammaproteobacteria bacterium]